MNTEKAIKLLREMQEAWKLQITGDAFDALEMAITALQVQDKLQDIEYMCRLSGGADYFHAFKVLSEKVKNTNTFLNNSNDEVKNRVKGMTACRVPEDDCISRQAAIDEITEYGSVDAIFMSVGELKRRIEHLPSVQPEPSQVARDIATIIENEKDMRVVLSQPEPLSDAYMKAVWTWLLDYQIKVAELKGRYTPYEVLSWVANDWRKEHDGSN